MTMYAISSSFLHLNQSLFTSNMKFYIFKYNNKKFQFILSTTKQNSQYIDL